MLILQKASFCKEYLKQCMVTFSTDSVLQGLGKVHVRQVMRAPFVFYLFVKKDSRFVEKFMTLFRDKSILVKNVNGGGYVQLF